MKNDHRLNTLAKPPNFFVVGLEDDLLVRQLLSLLFSILNLI